MPIKRPPLINDEIYHVVLRGGGDALVFKNDDDRYRGIFSLYEFNTTDPIEIREQRRRRKIAKASRGLFPDIRKHIVEILTFCFMPNHIHLLLRQIENGGISEFIRKLGSGYVGYFNKKYERRGPLFGKFRAVHIKNDEQLKTVFAYIHKNAISLIEPKWKENGIRNPKKVIQFLENYKWSSYLDYLGKENFPSETKRDFILKVMGGKEGCRDFVNGWVEYKKEFKDWNNIAIE